MARIYIVPSSQFVPGRLGEALTEENAKRCGRYYATDYIARELGLFD